jgi:hypothetical protein
MRDTRVAAICLLAAVSGLLGSAAAQEQPKDGSVPGGGRPAAPGYSMLQIHAFPNFDPYGKDIYKLMFDRIDVYRYGDDYFFLGVNSDYESDWRATRTETLYFKYAGNLSAKKVAGRPVMKPLFGSAVGDALLSVQINSGDLPYLRTVWLFGPAIDIAGLPKYGRLRFYFLVRKEDTQKTTHQVTAMWVQPFTFAKADWVFNGWGAHWSSDTTDDVVKFEPQLRLKLSSFLGEKNVLHSAMIGTELEVGYHYLSDPKTHELLDWRANPSVFFAMPF